MSIMQTISLHPRHTPWGDPVVIREHCPGIVGYVTGSHGGIWVASYQMENMPAELRAIQPFAAPGWYEEDCDWAIVCASFPHLFTGREVFEGWIIMRGEAKFASFFETPRGRLFVELARNFQRENAVKFLLGGCVTRGGVWSCYATRVDGLEMVTFKSPTIDLPRPFTHAEAIALGATDWRAQ